RHRMGWVERKGDGGSRRHNAWRLLQFVDQIFVELNRCRGSILITRFRQCDLNAEQVVGPEARINSDKLLKAPDQQSSQKQHKNSDRDFRGDEQASRPASSSCAAAAAWTQRIG